MVHGSDSKIDLALYQQVQTHYTANPVFMGKIRDPHEDGRVFFVNGERDTVPVYSIEPFVEMDRKRKGEERQNQIRKSLASRFSGDSCAMDKAIKEASSKSSTMRVSSVREIVTGIESGKPWWIGAVCTAYTIEDMIRTHLSDIYVEVSTGRYTYLHSKTSSKESAYINPHNPEVLGTCGDSDPVWYQRGHQANAFDLVRIHRFGHLDNCIDKSKIQVSQWPSSKAMVEWAKKDRRCKAAFDAKNAARASTRTAA